MSPTLRRSTLPAPALQRWQPLRAGLVDLFYYDTEEFWFRDGRLLLRGNNGTGKSKVLALMLPFLLDGDISAHRVEPDADPKKKMEWNLLLGGAHPNSERLGYTWLEFGRVDEHGVEQFRTLGCGLKAVSGRGITRHWYFVTEQRIGAGLTLVDATGTALSRERLDDALGRCGTLYDRARDYRRAVDETLFGFGEQRYRALVDLLVQLRQPQLSKRPSEKALSAALTEALPPLDQAVVADVAAAFRRLEEDRTALSDMTEARQAAAAFLGRYRRYAQIASRRRAEVPRNTQWRYEETNRALSAVQKEYAAADAELTAATRQQAELDTAAGTLRARDEALRASPEMRSARELEHAAKEASRLADDATRLAREHRDAQERLVTRQRQHESATERRTAAGQDLTEARAGASGEAERAGIDTEHAETIDSRLDTFPDSVPDLVSLRHHADRLVERQRRAITRVRALLDTLAETTRALAEARHTVTELDSAAADLAERRTTAEETVVGCGHELVIAVRRHLDDATELRLPDLATTLAELQLWVETMAGPNPVNSAASAAGQQAAHALATIRAGLDAAQQRAQTRRRELTEQIDKLESGEHDTPAPPHTRDDAGRAGRPGAPLWQLIDFTEGVVAEDRAGLEAALEASGVLDAWVLPSGELLDPATEDVLLRPDTAVPDALDTVLRPAIDREDPAAGQVSDQTVLTILASIGLGRRAEHVGTWVTTDGQFHIGVLAGAWHKPTAVHIGRGARESARRERLQQLRAELPTVDAELAGLAEQQEQLGTRRDILDDELSRIPADTALRQAHSTVTALAEEHRRLSAQRETAAQAMARASAAADQARAALDEQARDCGLPTDRDDLSAVDSALADYRVALARVWPAVRTLADLSARVQETTEELALATERLGEAAERASGAEQGSSAAAERHRTLRATVGAAVAELERQLAEVGRSLRDNEQQRRAARQRADTAIATRAKAEGRREELTDKLTENAEARIQATESFRRFVGTGLVTVALPHLELPDPAEPWAPNPTVRLARKVEEELADVAADDNAWDRAQTRLNEQLKSLIDTMSAQGNRVWADHNEDGMVVEVEFHGKQNSLPELATALEAEVDARERLLNEREREILENHLVNEVASTLHELISAAETQVAQMNSELSDRPTSTGMRLRLVWRPHEDGPPGLSAARERLRQTADAWSEQDRAAVGGFLQDRIAEVRARNAAGTWLEHLTEALDYRQWNRFVIQRHQNGEWKSASGPASGGERVLAASVPLFAAASAHYASAGNPHAPRLVTLDEAFAGVDDNARAKYLGLLAAFELDVVMTSEREWGCYREVPGLAISQLSRSDDVAAVLVTNWEWDGTRRTEVIRERAAIRSDAPAPAADPDLWD